MPSQKRKAKSEKMGKIAEKYCERDERDDKVRYRCNYRDLTDDQLTELGLKWWGSSAPPTASVMPDIDKCIGDGRNIKCDGVKLFHGTSKMNAKRITNSGFRPQTGIHGRGVYFAPSLHNLPTGHKSSPVRYAESNDQGTVVVTCIPRTAIRSFKELWNEGEKGMRINKEFQDLKADLPVQVEDFFNWHGSKYNDKRGLHAAYERLGKKVQDFMLANGIQAWYDGTQVVVYDETLLHPEQLKILHACDTEPSIAAANESKKRRAKEQEMRANLGL